MQDFIASIGLEQAKNCNLRCKMQVILAIHNVLVFLRIFSQIKEDKPRYATDKRLVPTIYLIVSLVNHNASRGDLVKSNCNALHPTR